MGLFSKLKDNFTHGGVKVGLEAPASVSMTDSAIPVTVTVSASDKQETIDRVSALLIARSLDRGFTQPTNGSLNNANQGQEITVAEANFAQQFTIMPGETKTVQLSIVMNQGAAMASQLPEDSIAAKFASALQNLQSISEVMNDTSYSYDIRVTAKVSGVVLSPSKQQPIQLRKPGQMGGAVQL